MEENKTKITKLNSAKEVKKEENNATLDAAKVQAIVQQAQVKIQQLTDSVRQLDQMLRDKTVDQMFSVIKHAAYFDQEFVDKCAKGIQSYITAIALTPETPAEAETKEPVKED